MTSLFAILAAALFAAPQSLGTGTITGVVEDSSSAIVSDVDVYVREVATGLTRTSRTNDSGQFNLPVVPPGEYVIVVEKPGFTRIQRANLVVTVGRTVTLQFVLQPGAVGETVSVTAEAPLLDTSKTEETSLIDRMQIDNLPIN